MLGTAHRPYRRVSTWGLWGLHHNTDSLFVAELFFPALAAVSVMVLIAVPIMAMVAFFPLFFQLVTPLLCLPAMVAMLPLGVSQVIFGFVNAFLASIITIDCPNLQGASQEQ